MKEKGKFKLLVIDTETGGYDPIKESLLTFAAVIWENEALGESIEIQVKERRIVADPEAIRKNRVDLSQLKDRGLSPRASVDRFEQFLAAHYDSDEVVILAGHNVSFDVGFLKRLYRLAERDYPAQISHRLFDTAAVLKFLEIAGILDLDTSGSDAAFQYFNIPINPKERHTAIGDAIATGTLISHLIRLVKSE